MAALHVADILGLALEVLEEEWNSEDGPQPEEICVFQRCLVLLGYPTGDQGRPWIDGEFGPNTRRALKQYQEENGFAVTGRFEPEIRRRLYDDAAAYLTALPEPQRVHAHGQIRRLQNQTPVGTPFMVRYYPPEAERVDEPLRAAFLALVAWANRAVTVPGLDLPLYRKNLGAGLDAREARLAALRYGFLQMTAAQHAELGLDAARAVNPGDLDFHFDVVAAVLKNVPAVRDAAASQNAEALALALPWAHADCTLKAAFGLPFLLADIATALARTEKQVD
jgi:hypothetical protein